MWARITAVALRDMGSAKTSLGWMSVLFTSPVVAEKTLRTSWAPLRATTMNCSCCLEAKCLISMKMSLGVDMVLPFLTVLLLPSSNAADITEAFA